MLQQESVISRIRGLFSGVARRVDTGSAAEAVDLNTRIISKNKARAEARVIVGLEASVLLEGGARLGRSRNPLKPWQRLNRDLGRAEQAGRLPDVLELAAIGSADVDDHFFWRPDSA